MVLTPLKGVIGFNLPFRMIGQVIGLCRGGRWSGNMVCAVKFGDKENAQGRANDQREH